MRCCGWVAGCVTLAVVATIAIIAGMFFFMGHAVRTTVKELQHDVRATPAGLAVANPGLTAMTNVRISIDASSSGSKSSGLRRFTTTVSRIGRRQLVTIPWKAFKAANGHGLNTRIFHVESYDMHYQFVGGAGQGSQSGSL